MTTVGPSPWTPRRTLRWTSVILGGALAIWTAGSVLDLGDGQTWDRTKRRYAWLAEKEGFDVNEFGFYRVAHETHPKQFRQIVILRGVMPSVLLGVTFGVFALGWSAQPRTPSGTQQTPDS
ncbi:MAG: hypothetical protein IBJ02_00220 [Brevundimonas sp.]|nr:hypothetical protein [Brevundimonas sp.]